MHRRILRGLLPGLVLMSGIILFTSLMVIQAAAPGLSSPYTQNFDSLSNSGTNNAWTDDSTLAGWYSNRTLYLASTGSLNNGGLYSFGDNASSERALGSIGSGSASVVYYAVALTNDTGSVIDQISIAYQGEQWRNGGNTTPHSLTVSYQVNADNIEDGTWTDIPALEYTGPVASATAGALDGNSNAVNLAESILLTLDPGDTIWIRWRDPDNTGSDHGLAIDNVAISAGEPGPTSTPSSTHTPGTPTPTSTSTDVPVPCVTAPDFIYQLQEGGSKHNPSGSASASRTVIGIVTGDYQLDSPNGLNGYYVQDEVGDGNPNTSDGIFVYDPAPFLLDVTPGQRIQLTGTTREQFGQTQFDPTAVIDCGSTGTITPVTVTLPISSLAAWENYEGMLVTVSGADTNPLTVTETFTLARFGEVVVSAGGRLFNPTNFVEPGAAAVAAQALNDRSRLLIDDGRDGTPPDGQVPFIPTTATEFRQGFTTPSVTGILGYGFNTFRLQPTTPITWTPANPRTPVADVGGSLRVSSFNVLNYFNGNGAGGGFPTSRGADSAAELARQQTKIVAAIIGLNADIIALNELENDNPATENAAIEQLISALNASAGAGTFDFIDTGVLGTDEIRVGLIYKPGKVTPVGGYAKLDNVAPFNVNTRPPLAQLFEENATGGRFYIIANHFKSKGCSGASGGNADQGDGQSCYNPTRVQAANVLMNWINTNPYFIDDPDVMIIGDLNAYAQEDPIDALKNGGYTNLIETFVGPGNVAYSYTFEGQSGYLDHALANASLLSQVTGATEWHINADEPIGRDYNDDILDSSESTTELRQPYLYEPNAYRASDHDPVVIGLNLVEGASTTPTATDAAPTATATDAPPTETATATTTDDAPPTTATPTETATTEAGIELLQNGGFEARKKDKPDLSPWVLASGDSKDKLKCNKGDAFEGDCTFMFKGSSNENSKLKQKVSLENFSFAAGDRLVMGGYVNAKKAQTKGDIRVRVAYTDKTLPKGKITIDLHQTSGYEPVSGALEVFLASGDIKKIVFTVKHLSPKGKVNVDNLSLMLFAGDGGRSSDLLPLP